MDSYYNDMNKQESIDKLLKELKEYARDNHIPVISADVAQLLTVLVSIKKPQNLLEIGTAIGYSAILMAAEMDEAAIIDTIERYGVMVKAARENIKKAGLQDRIRVIAGEASDVLACLDKKYDFIFLDASKGQYVEFLPYCLRLLNAQGIIVTDNVHFRGMVYDEENVIRRKRTIVVRLREYIRKISNDERLETIILPMGDGVAVSVMKDGGKNEKG